MSKIYVVSEFGGQYEDSWESILHAFTSKEEAEKFAKETEESNTISDELYSEIEDYRGEEEYNFDMKWFDYGENGECVYYEGKTEDEYMKAYDDFIETTLPKMVEDKFGVDNDAWETANRFHTWDVCGCRVEEVELD